MKKYFNVIIKILIIIGLFVLTACEPISVSVNSKGEIAFTRTEGVFYTDIKKQKVDVLDWNFGQTAIPVIVRWSPKEDAVCVTVKESKDSTNTTVYIIDKKGEKKQMYSVGKIISQIEWSQDGSYISLAQAGDDTDMSVADLVLISVKDGMSKVFAKNAGDVHKWLDDKTIAFIKISKKNKDNSDIMLGDLTRYKADANKFEIMAKTFVSKSSGSIDADKTDVAFIAIDAGENVKDFVENMTGDTYCFFYNLKSNSVAKISENKINYAKFSPDGSKLLIKYKEENAYTSTLGYLDLQLKQIILLSKESLDTVSANSSTVQVYPTWLDNSTVLYFRSLNTFGSNGQSLNLFSIDIKELKQKNNQVFIDTEIYKLVEKKGGY